MGSRILLFSLLVSLMLVACGTSDRPADQSLAQTTAPDDPFPVTTSPMPSAAALPPSVTAVSATPHTISTETPQAQATLEQPATETAAPVQTITVRQTQIYTMSDYFPLSLAAWAPDDSALLAFGGYHHPSEGRLGSLILGTAEIFDLDTATHRTIDESAIIGYLEDSYRYPTSYSKWTADGIWLGHVADKTPYVVQIDPPTTEQTRRGRAEHGLFAVTAAQEVIHIDGTLQQPQRAAQVTDLPQQPELIRLTQLSEELLVYAPTSITLQLRELATGTETTWSLAEGPLDMQYSAQPQIVNLALAPDSQTVAIAVGYGNEALDIWVLDIKTKNVQSIKQTPFLNSTLLVWSPDSSLLHYTTRPPGTVGRERIWELYDIHNQYVVYQGTNTAISFVWNSTATRFAILESGQTPIITYEVLR